MTSPSDGTNQQSGNQPPGWYPIDPANQQYWDGSQWVGSPQPTQPIQGQTPGQWAQKPLINGTTSDERTMAMITHLLIFVAAGIGPLIMYFIKKDESPFVRHHAAEALNLIITTLIATIGVFVLGLILIALGAEADGLVDIGFIFFILSYFVLLAFMIGGAVLSVMGAVKANKGEAFRMPLILHLVK